MLLMVGAISYLFMLNQMGFYWDDWQAVFLGQINDAGVTAEYFSYDRPFSAWTYDILFPWLPMTPIAYHILSLLARVGAIFLLVTALDLLWPERAWQLRWAGLILLVFPEFSLQPVAVAFSQHLITFLLFSLSLFLTGLAVIHPARRWIYLPLAILTTAVQMFTMEYFVGLEMVRLVYIYLLVNHKEKILRLALRKTLTIWIPYLIVICGFCYWRIAIYPAQRLGNPPNDPVLLKQILTDPGQGLSELFTKMVNDTIYLLVHNWIDAIIPDTFDLSTKATVFSYFAGLITTIVAVLCLSHVQQKKSTNNSDHFHLHGSILGVITIICGGLPIWITARQITEGKWSGRFSLAPMLGVVFLLILAIDWLIRTQKQKQVILAIILGLSIAFQIRNVNKYRLDWAVQRDFYWQLSWRIPALEPGTAVIAPTIPSEKNCDYCTAFAINVLYGAENLSPDAPYWFFTPRDIGGAFTKLEPGHEIIQGIRSVQFSGSTSNAVALYYKSSQRCLKVLDPIYMEDPFLKEIDPLFFTLTNFKRISSIDSTTAPPIAVFGKEPEHGWCYYFQKADLARQNGQWQDVIDLTSEAFELDFRPATGSELLPLLDAHLHLGNWDQAVETVHETLAVSDPIEPAICSLVARHSADPQFHFPEDVRERIMSLAGCQPSPLAR